MLSTADVHPPAQAWDGMQPATTPPLYIPSLPLGSLVNREFSAYIPRRKPHLHTAQAPRICPRRNVDLCFKATSERSIELTQRRRPTFTSTSLPTRLPILRAARRPPAIGLPPAPAKYGAHEYVIHKPEPQGHKGREHHLPTLTPAGLGSLPARRPPRLAHPRTQNGARPSEINMLCNAGLS
ncbi:hypothetical protein CSOJ01_14047 [Colletotrichum sojae]|uniref:Uncharacterized protein n=1 Tax=Colletotrichum sojae TaxID=2175907 RepID=A0A8H6IQT7_9PEZI|nr:hypothetical protein CSOJ01_14047 [Colletotrichum sojae]